MWHFVVGALFATILSVVYALVSMNVSVSEVREAMNTHQMHLVNLHNQNRLEAKEAMEREKRFVVKLGQLESRLQELTRAIRPNYIDGVPVMPHVEPSSTPAQKKTLLLNMLEEMQSDSPKQPRETFIQLLSTIGETFSDQDSRPAGIVILIPPHFHSKSFTNCFALKLARNVNRIFTGSSHQVNPKELSKQDALDTPDVTTIHTELKGYFNYEGGKAVVVWNVEQIQSHEFLMMFHAFCDNVMAYDTQATFIFTLNVPQNLYDKYNWVEANGYRITYETLKNAWANVLTPDKTPALISRMALANILLRDGDSC
jgi:hypothetical protein